MTFTWQLIVSVGAGAGIGFIVYKIMRVLEPQPRERTAEDRLEPFRLPDSGRYVRGTDSQPAPSSPIEIEVPE